MTLTEELTTAVRHACPDAPAPATSTLTVERLTCQDWDTACARFDGICPEQTYAFSRVRWPSLQQEPLLFRRGHEVVGGALMMIQPLSLRLGAVAIGKWAPMLCDDRRPDSRLLYRGMIDGLVAEYADGRNMMLSILPRAFGDGRNDEIEYLAKRGFVAGSNVPFPSRYIVCLRRSEDAHRRQLGAKWRYHLNKSEKNELTFEAADRALLPQFSALYEAMCNRKKFSDHSAYNTVPALMAMQMEFARPRLFFVRHHGEIVCGAVIFTAGETAIYLYGATDDRALPLRAGYFMHWQIIRWLKAETRARWYDLGGSDGFLGLHQFKKGMIGKAGAIVPLPPMMHFARRKLPLMTGRSAFALRDAILNARERLSTRWSDRAKPDLTPDKV